MPRDRTARSAGAYALDPGRKPPPRHLSRDAKALWREIVADRPGDFFRPGAFALLAQYCAATAEGQKIERKLGEMGCDREDYADLASVYVKLGNLRNATATKLRLAVQHDYRRDARRVVERRADDEVTGDDLLAGEDSGWAFPTTARN